MEMKWYAIQCRGNELKLIENIKNVLEVHKLSDEVGEILVPTEDIIEVKKGVKEIKERSLYAGYVYINANLTKRVQEVIQSLPTVFSFINDGVSAVPLTDNDIKNIKNKIENKGEAKPKFNYENGDTVLITEGPFANFKGEVEKYELETGMLHLDVLIFGRKTPVEISFTQVEKVED